MICKGLYGFSVREEPVSYTHLEQFRHLWFHDVDKSPVFWIELLHSKDWGLIDIMKPKMTELLRQYYFVGGMPGAVSYTHLLSYCRIPSYRLG